MTDFPERVAIAGTVGVHAARTVPEGDARFTACGLTVDRRNADLAPATETTCWCCRRELDPPEGPPNRHERP